VADLNVGQLKHLVEWSSICPDIVQISPLNYDQVFEKSNSTVKQLTQIGQSKNIRITTHKYVKFLYIIIWTQIYTFIFYVFGQTITIILFLIFNKELDFLANIMFLRKISIFDKNFDILPKFDISIFYEKFYQHLNFNQNLDC